MTKLKMLIIFMILSALVFLSACSAPDTSSPSPAKLPSLRLVGTIGPLSIPLAYMAQNNSLADVAEDTTLDIWANPTQLQAIITGGQGDFVSLPTNSAATFFNRGVALKLLDSSIWNILYVVTADTSIKSIIDLRGKRVVVPYQAAVPDAMFRFVCQEQGINPDTDIEIIYAPDPVQGSQLLLSGQEQYALLSEPSATGVILQGQRSGTDLARALNMEAEWQKATGGGSSTPVAGTLALGPIADRKDVIDTFLAEYQRAVRWMLDNPVEAGNVGANVLAEQGFTAAILTESLQNIDWNFVPAADARPSLEAFYNALTQVSPNFIGGQLPADDFYYQP
ncbi:MAG: hypothetical protein PHU23_17015 [Dehalococcoidales bacterium]|nr:hypothetical protein [Dehalococcoidales bacterium]